MFLIQNNKPFKFSYKYSLKFLLLSFPALMMIGCATSHRGKVFESMAIGAVVGGLYGQSRPEFKQENSLMYGSMGSAVGAVIGVLRADPDKENSELQSKIDSMNRILAESEKEQSQVLEKSLGALQAHDVDKLRRKGWSERKIDSYFQVAPNFIYHSVGIITPDPKYLLDE